MPKEKQTRDDEPPYNGDQSSGADDKESSGSESIKSDDKRYNLRLCSQVNRVLVERRKEEPKRPKPKSRPPPLSKYRRKTANSRERTRMNEINDAFEDLRKAIPNYPTGKMTKITTLRLALNYMSALREMLGFPDTDGFRTSSVSSADASSSPPSVHGSTGSVSDCSSPEPCSSSPPSTSEEDGPFDSVFSSNSMDIDTDASLNQLFELKLDPTLDSGSIEDVLSDTGTAPSDVVDELLSAT